MCVMMTEIQTIDGDQKRSLLTRGDQIYKKIIKKSFNNKEVRRTHSKYLSLYCWVLLVHLNKYHHICLVLVSYYFHQTKVSFSSLHESEMLELRQTVSPHLTNDKKLTHFWITLFHKTTIPPQIGLGQSIETRAPKSKKTQNQKTENIRHLQKNQIRYFPYFYGAPDQDLPTITNLPLGTRAS